MNPADAKRFKVGMRLIEPKRGRMRRIWQFVKCKLHLEPCVTITAIDYETGSLEVRAGR